MNSPNPVNVFELFHEDMFTSSLFIGMMFTMLIAFPFVLFRLKRGLRAVFVGYSCSHCISFYFLFSCCLPSRMQTLGIYWDILPECHLGLFALTWFFSIVCLVILILKMSK